MPPEVIVNFKGADPVSGGGKFDRVPEGTYHVKVIKADSVKTSTDKPALACTIAVSKGEYKGKKVSDWFVLPRKGTNDSIFGVQRLHGLMVATGMKRQSGKVKLVSIAKALTNRECVCEIVDSTLPETESQKSRTVSSPEKYYSAKEAAKLKKEQADAEDGDDEEDTEEEEGDDEEEDSDDDSDDEDAEDEEESDEDGEDEEEEDEEPPKKKRAKADKSSGKKKSKKDEDDDDDLYDDED